MTPFREWRRQEEETMRLRERLQGERARLNRRLDQRRRSVETKSRRDRETRRRTGASDSDVRSAAVKMRQARAAAARSKDAGVDAENLARVEERLADLPVARRPGGSVSLASRSARRHLLLSHHGSLRAGEKLLREDINVDVERDSRLRVAGPNGSGKSTLLRGLVDGATAEGSSGCPRS